MLSHIRGNMFRLKNLCLIPKSADPGKKLWAYDYICTNGKMIRPVRNQHNIPSQAINHRANQMIFKPKLNRSLVSGKHTKGLSGIFTHIQRSINFLTVTLFFRDINIGHLIHTEMLDPPRL